MKKRGFTLIETTIVMVILGVIAVVLLTVSKPGEIKQKAMEQAAIDFVSQVERTMKEILLNHTKDYSLLNIVALDNTTFSIASSDKEASLSALFKKYLVGLRGTSLPNIYLSSSLQDSSGVASGYTVSSFLNGYKVKNGAYIAFKLNGNCTTSETKIYNPAMPDNRTETNSCGLVFYDINSEAPPNNLGVDQFILSIGKYGIK